MIENGQEKNKLRKKIDQVLRSFYKLRVKMRKECLKIIVAGYLCVVKQYEVVASA